MRFGADGLHLAHGGDLEATYRVGKLCDQGFQVYSSIAHVQPLVASVMDERFAVFGAENVHSILRHSLETIGRVGPAAPMDLPFASKNSIAAPA